MPSDVAEQPPAIVLGGAANAVSIARSLAPDGIAVYALGTGGVDCVRWSRHCRRYVAFRGDEALQADWLAWLDAHAAALPGAVLLPANDEALELIARNRPALVQLGYRPFEANDEALLAMLDKDRTYEIARTAGIPAPRTIAIDDEGSRAAAIDELGFPLALKPLHSHVLARLDGHWGKVVVVADRPALERTLRALDTGGVRVLATEVIPGGDDRLLSYYSYIDADGEPLVELCKQQLRAFPPHFGLSTYHRTIWDAEVAELGLRFFRAAGVRGLVNVQFKRDAVDGRLKLIECNHRFTAANELVRLAGVNLAALTYRRALGLPSPPIGAYRVDMRLWDPIHDTRALLALRAAGETTTAAWLGSLRHRTYMPLLRAEDPAPALLALVRASRALRRSRRNGSRA